MIAAPLAGYDAEVGAALWRLGDARRRTLDVLADVPVGIIDTPVDGATNTIGTILYHVALIETDWLYSEILEAEPPPEIVGLLPADHRDEAGILTAIRGEDPADHLARLSTVREHLLRELRPMTAADLWRPRRLPAYDVTPAWVLHHLAQHEAEHRGEIGSLLASLRQETTK